MEEAKAVVNSIYCYNVITWEIANTVKTVKERSGVPQTVTSANHSNGHPTYLHRSMDWVTIHGCY